MEKQTIATLSAGLESGKTTARALVEASLAAIADPAGEGSRAFISVDAEGARAAADYMDSLRKAGRHPSPYAGIPFSVKDLFDLAGEVTTAGSKLLRNQPKAKADAPAIARLKAKGFIVMGRSNMTEFAYSGVGLNPHYGTPRSPYDRKTGRIPGGSSAGAAVSVADGMVPLGIGSDTGGSCRIPASYCGITGFKPSTGQVPTQGAFPLSASFDSVGPLANSVACCATVHAIMAAEAEIVPTEFQGLRLAILKDFVLDGLEAPVAAAFERTLTKISRAGAQLTDLNFPELKEIPTINSKGGIVAAEAYHIHRQRLAERGDEYDPRVRFRIEAAASISAADYLDYFTRRRVMIEKFSHIFNGFDAVALPTTLNSPPAIAELATDKDYLRFNAMSLRNTYVANFLDGCAISLPMTVPGEATCGFMIMSPWGRDAGLLNAAASVENTLKAAS